MTGILMALPSCSHFRYESARNEPGIQRAATAGQLHADSAQREHGLQAATTQQRRSWRRGRGRRGQRWPTQPGGFAKPSTDGATAKGPTTALSTKPFLERDIQIQIFKLNLCLLFH